MPTARSAWKLAILVGAVLIAGYFVLPGAGTKDIGYTAIGVGSMALVLAAVAIRRPAERRGWWYLAIGNLLFVLANGVYDYYQFVAHRPPPAPSVVDALYLLAYPFIFAGVVRLTRDRRQARSQESYANAAIVSIGAIALAWQFVMGPYAHASTVAVLGRLVNEAYPVMDIGIIFIVMQGLIFGGARRPTHKLLATAIASMLAADFAYYLVNLHGTYATGNPLDAGWLIGFVLLGVAALHPSMAKAPTEAPTAPVDSRRRLPLVAFWALTAPAVLLVTAVIGAHADLIVLAAATIAGFVVIFVRMRWRLAPIGGQAGELPPRTESRQESLGRAVFGVLMNEAERTIRVQTELVGQSE